MEKSITLKFWNLVCRHKYLIAIIGILILGAILRYSGYNWDNLYQIHPDERALNQAADKIDFFRFKLDPELYAYGSLPVYLTQVVKSITSLLFPFNHMFNSYIIIGRLISATSGILTVLFVYLIGKKLYNKNTGLLSGLLLTVSVLHIQNSHFATVDILLTFFITATIYFLIDIYYANATTNTYYIVSIMIGLTLAVKVSAAPVVLIFFLCHVISLIRQKKHFQLKPYLFFALCGLIALLVNFLAQPYAFIHFSKYWESVIYQIDMQKHASACYTQQYIGTPFLFYYLKEFVLRCMGPPLGLLCIVSFIIAIITTILHPIKSKHILLLLWAVPYFITINSFESKFLRYLLPLFPFLCLFAGYYFIKLYSILQSNKTKRAIRTLLAFILIGYTAFYALAFVNLYMKPHTFVIGSKWFHTNAPENSIVLSQHWDEGFPLNLQSIPLKKYTVNYLEHYELKGLKSESVEKASYLAENLEKGDYIVVQTRRIYGAIQNVPDRYPITRKYFDLLFTNRLGFEPIKEFTSYPSLLGIEILDDLSDESFSVYEHPKILIFKKNQQYNKQDYLKLLTDKESTVLSKNQVLSYRIKDQEEIKEYTLLDEALIISYWIIIIELISLLGFVLGFIIFKKSKASMVFLSYLLGLLGFSYIVWLLVSLNFIKYSFFYIFTLFLFALIIALTYIGNNKTHLTQWVKDNLDTIVLSKLVFITIFLIILALRSLSPEIYWGEKPMDFGFLNNLIRTDSLPPDEIWFCGQTLNYYYYGHFIFATLAKLTSIPSYFVFNLAIATLAGITFSAACGVTFLLTKNYFYTILSGVITIFLGNLSGIREFLFGDNPINFHFFWATSRVIPHTVNEYPLWSFLFGDLHAHVIVMSIFIFVLYLGAYLFTCFLENKYLPWCVILLTSFSLGTISTTNSWDAPGASALLFVCFTAGIILSQYSYTGREKFFYIVKNYIILTLIGLSSFIWFVPYWLNTKKASVIGFGFISQGEAINIDDYLLIWGLFLFIFTSFFLFEIFYNIRKIVSTRYHYNTSTLISWISSGVILFILTLIIIYSKLLTMFSIFLLNTTEFQLNENIYRLIKSLIHSCDFGSMYTTGLFVTLLIILGTLTFFLLKEAKIKFICLLIIFGLTMTLFTDIFFIYDRMNTVFKFFLEAWYLFSICATFVLYYLFRPHYFAFRRSKKISGELVKLFWIIPASLLLILAAFTSIASATGFSFSDHTSGYKPTKTINGLKYLKYRVPSEYLAINWINNHIKESKKFILEAEGGPYSDYTRVVMNTGIPSVVGWTHHLTQRAIPRELIEKRIEDVKTIYTTNDLNLACYLLGKYQVKFIYIGPLEEKTYNAEGLKKFKTNPNIFKPVYTDRAVSIYQVL